MSLWKFMGWSIVGIGGTFLLSSTFENKFLLSLIVGLIIGFMGAKD